MGTIKDLKNLFGSQGDSIQKHSKIDGNLELTGETLEELMEIASEYLEIPKECLEYEIVEEGQNKFFGLIKTLFRVRFSKKKQDASLHQDEILANRNEIAFSGGHNVDALVKIRIEKSGIYLCFQREKGSGKSLVANDVRLAFSKHGLYNNTMKDCENFLRLLEKQSKIRVGDWVPNERYDSKLTVNVHPDNMGVFVSMSKPVLSGRILDKDDVVQALSDANIVFGIQMSAIDAMLQQEKFNQPVLIAKGLPPVKGKNGYLEFLFATEEEKRLQFFKEQETQSNLDYHEMNLIPNVIVGQVIAVYHPPQAGRPGKTVFGKELQTEFGKPLEFVCGKNVRFSNETNEIQSLISGRPRFSKDGEINVEPVYIVKGDVGYNTGNIVFLGDVEIHGGVTSGFEVKVSGNLTIDGNIHNAKIEADQNIVVKQGILGSKTSVYSGGSLQCKFIEQSHVIAEQEILVRESIMHSAVESGNSIVCFGNKASIVGGNICALNLIEAKYLGGTAYPVTLLDVGLDPKYKRILKKLVDEKQESDSKIEQLSKNINTLKKLESTDKLSLEKAKILKKMTLFLSNLESRYPKILHDIEEIHNYFQKTDFSKSMVLGKAKVYPGVQIRVHNIDFKVKHEMESTQFIFENHKIFPRLWNKKN